MACSSVSPHRECGALLFPHDRRAPRGLLEHGALDVLADRVGWRAGPGRHRRPSHALRRARHGASLQADDDGLPVLAVLFLAAAPDTRDRLRRPALWAVLFGSYLSLIPPLVWNACHDWITFQHTTIISKPAVTEEIRSWNGSGTSPRFSAPSWACSRRHGLRRLFPEPRGPAPPPPRDAPPPFPSHLRRPFPRGMILLALRQEIQPNWARSFTCPGSSSQPPGMRVVSTRDSRRPRGVGSFRSLSRSDSPRRLLLPRLSPLRGGGTRRSPGPIRTGD